MKVKCDTDKMSEISANFGNQIDRYKEIVMSFYEIVHDFQNNGWTGTAADNYTKYLDAERTKFNKIENELVSFNKALKNNIDELNYAISISKVKNND